MAEVISNSGSAGQEIFPTAARTAQGPDVQSAADRPGRTDYRRAGHRRAGAPPVLAHVSRSPMVRLKIGRAGVLSRSEQK